MWPFNFWSNLKMNPTLFMQILNTSLPLAIAAYKMFRDANPDQPALTDAEIADLAITKHEDVAARGRAYLADHPLRFDVPGR